MQPAPHKIWWSASELAEASLPDVPDTKRGVTKLAKREGWANTPGKMRRRKEVGGGFEYHWSVLPLRARTAISDADRAPIAKPDRPSQSEAWTAYDALSATAKKKAEYRLGVVNEFEELHAAGVTRSEAARVVAERHSVSVKTVWNWQGLVEGVPAKDRLAYIVPKNQTARRTKQAAKPHPDFFALIKSDFLRLEQPSLTSCYDRAVKIAQREGIPVAPIHQIRSHYKATVSKPTEVFLRKGSEALRRFFPHQTRDKSAMSVMECVQGDFHKFDVWVMWPTEAEPVRIQAVFFSDIYSGKLLTYRLSTTANSHTVQLAIGDMIERYGIPQAALLDNGREFAAKVITGGTKTRFRFKVSEEDIPGLLPLMGVKVHWATPYSGQSKPIERAFRDLCDRVAKHPAFAGAYTGNKPDAKPENYRSHAVPIEEFRAVLDAEVQAHNERPNRRSEVAFGRSFEEVFNEGFKAAKIRRATEEQRRLWLLGAEGIMAAKKNGEMKLFDSRYWSEWMYRIAGQKVVARFDPDALHDGLHIYDLTGAYLGHAACLEKGQFLDVDAAREVARKRGQFMRTVKAQAKAEKELTAAEIAARLKATNPDVTPLDLPMADVVQLPTPHKNAPKPARKRRANTSAQSKAAKRGVELLESRRHAKTDTGETANDRFARASDLIAQRDQGHPLTDDQERWLSNYQLSAEFRGQMRTQRLFGDKAK